MGLGIGSGLIAPNLLAYKPPTAKIGYPGIRSLSDATNENGETAVRLAFGNGGKEDIGTRARIKVSKKGNLSRTQSYFLEPPDQWMPRQNAADLQLHPGDSDILVAWIQDAEQKTLVKLSLGKEKWQFSLGELLAKGELRLERNLTVTANLLGYIEVGRLTIQDLGIQDQENFRFAIMADPQGGDPTVPTNEAPTRIKIHNAFIEDTVERINELDPLPSFTLILGDFVDSKGQAGNFQEMERLIKPLKMPVLLEVGNHESPYKTDFTPAYNMSDLDNFFDSQDRVNGTKKVLYSFDIGQWHFVVWPDPLRPNFWATHPHYLDWLKQDLEKNQDRPTVFLQHVPLHPIGIDPLTSYVESVSVKKLLIDILAEHGNVKYVFSGHVHIPLKASLKTAVSYRGMNMINLPAAGFRPRAFGESDFFGGPEQGVCAIDIAGKDLTVHFQHVTKEWFTYPKNFREFDDQDYALWFSHPWELPLQSGVVNGDFSEGLQDWHRRFVYHEDENPSNAIEVREGPDQEKAFYLYSRKRDYDVPGQDRLPQHINRIAQAVSLRGMVSPTLQLTYRLDENRYDPKSLNGFFVWLECYSGAHNVSNLIYSAGKVYGSLTKGFGKGSGTKDYHFDLPSKVGKWHDTTLPFASDFSSADEEKRDFKELDADRAVIYLGTWTVNEGIGQEAGVFIRQVAVADASQAVSASPIKNDGDIWYSRIDHIAGDHQYTEQAMVYPSGLQGKGEPLNGYSNG